MSTWVGIIFLMSFSGTVGLNEEYFNSKEACWEYFDKHPSFKSVQTYDTNHYHVHAKVVKYDIDEVGMAFVTCKKKMYNETTSPHGDPKPDKQVPGHEHNHDHDHGSHDHN